MTMRPALRRIAGLILLASCGGDLEPGDIGGERQVSGFSGHTLPGGVSDVVNGRKLSAQQQRSLRFVAEKVVPPLATYHGSRAVALDRASLVAWWALKEGTMDVSNPIAYSLCDRPRVNLTSQVAGICSRHAWQVGIAAIQAPRPHGSPANWFTQPVGAYIAQYETTVGQAFPGKSAGWALGQAARQAGYGAHEQTIVSSVGYVRAAWLLRVGAVGYVHEFDTINNGCVKGSASWCFSSAWYPSSAFAPSRGAMTSSRANIRAILDAMAPTCYGGVRDADGELFKDLPPGATGHDEAQKLHDAGVTQGCQAAPCRLFCPDDAVTRGQMAAFIVRAANLPIPSSAPPFSDVPATHPFAKEIAALVAAKITQGCGDGTSYCPDTAVTRGQMAAFISRAKGWTSWSGSHPGFLDVPPSHAFHAQIMALASHGVTQGCGDGTKYCPDQPITRGQMAVFLARAFGL